MFDNTHNHGHQFINGRCARCMVLTSDFRAKDYCHPQMAHDHIDDDRDVIADSVDAFNTLQAVETLLADTTPAVDSTFEDTAFAGGESGGGGGGDSWEPSNDSGSSDDSGSW